VISLAYRLSKRMRIEGLTWRQFDHPNIVKFLGMYEETSGDRVRLVLVSVRIEENLRFYIRSAAYKPHVDRKRLVGVFPTLPWETPLINALPS
jgi:hypothetical protein